MHTQNTMYIINIQTITAKEVINPDAKYKDTDLTNLDFEWLSIKQSERDVIYFKQNELPNCDPKYDTIVNNQIVEMTTEQKTAKDLQLEIERKIVEWGWLYPDRQIRATVKTKLTYTDPLYENFSSRMLRMNVPSVMTEGTTIEDDTTTAYIRRAQKTDGFYLEHGIIKHPDPRMFLEQLQPASENAQEIFILV